MITAADQSRMHIATAQVESEIRSVMERLQATPLDEIATSFPHDAEADPLELRLLLKWQNADFGPIELRFATMRAK